MAALKALLATIACSAMALFLIVLVVRTGGFANLAHIVLYALASPFGGD